MNLAEYAVKNCRASQDPWELSVTLDILAHHVRPALVLEIGSWWGGTLFAWGSLGARVIAMTLPETRDFLDGNSHGAQVLFGNSHDAEAEPRIREACDGQRIDFAFIDGDHTREGCQADLDLCLRLGAAVIGFHDISGIGDPGVREVWDQAKARWPYAEIIRPSAKAVGTGIIWT